jgi:hypothetical protein
MYDVTSQYNKGILAEKRQVVGRVVIDYSVPEVDSSITVTANENAYIVQNYQVTNGVLESTRKWASLDGTWVLDGTYFLSPDTEDAAVNNELGWWGETMAGTGGAFSAPYPTLIVEFSSRVVSTLQVVGDSMRGEYPVDFNIYLYNSDILLYTETVTGNAEIAWEKPIAPIGEVTKSILEITKWSHDGRQAKIVEFFPILHETYTGDDLFSLSLLEEREVSNGNLPIGNISCNELDISIFNRDRKFDAGNRDSRLYQLIKPNRKVRAWLGLVLPDEKITQLAVFGIGLGQMLLELNTTHVEWIPLGTFYTLDWDVPELDITAGTTARDRLQLLDNSTYSADELLKDATFYDIAVDVLTDAGLRMNEYFVDEELKNYSVNYGCVLTKPNDKSHRECLRSIVEACLGQCYMDRNGILRIEGPSYLVNEKTTIDATITRDDYFTKNNPAAYEELANYIIIKTQPYLPESETSDIYMTDDDKLESIAIGETKTVTIEWDDPAINCTAALQSAPAGLTITGVVYRPYGADVTVNGATVAGTFKIAIMGYKLGVSNEIDVIAKDDQSIKENGLKKYSIDENPLIQTKGVAQAIADKCLELSKDPRRDLELEWRGNPALELGDRINVPDSKTTTADFWVVFNQLEWDGTLSQTTKGKKVI